MQGDPAADVPSPCTSHGCHGAVYVSWLCRHAHRLVRLPVRALALARAAPHSLASRPHAARRGTPGPSRALGLERQLFAILQQSGIPAGARVERQHARARLPLCSGLATSRCMSRRTISGFYRSFFLLRKGGVVLVVPSDPIIVGPILRIYKLIASSSVVRATTSPPTSGRN